MTRILVLNGPNLNLLGSREPTIYGSTTLDDIQSQLKQIGERHQVEVLFYQSNAEHQLIDHIHQAQQQGIQFILMNPAAFTHTSIAIRDALLGVGIPFIELHLSNVHAREPFRRHSYLSDIAVGVIAGFGAQSYELALLAAIAQLQKST